MKKVDTIEPVKLSSILNEELNKSLRLFVESDDGNANEKEKFNSYLKQLCNRAPVMVFMKGEPNAPRCGFSKQLVALLAKQNVKYEYFDILEDEEVRQGLKEYSDWPAYPQMYHVGKFIGGGHHKDTSIEIIESTFKI